MKFNEKLIELRKQKGLSQEELGYKLNVTRQTVSKWELGQTTPEMDKLVELSKIFGVTIDELTSQEETVEAIKTDEKSTDKNKDGNTKKILIGLCIGVVILVVISGLWGASKKKEREGIFEIIENVFSRVLGKMDEMEKEYNDDTNRMKEEFKNNVNKMQEDHNDSVNKMKEEYNDNVNKMKDAYNNSVNDMRNSSFNATLEMYAGSARGLQVKAAIDEIVTNNKKNKDRIVTVVYKGVTTSDSTELQNLKSNFKDLTEYEVSYEYNESGIIYQMDIK